MTMNAKRLHPLLLIAAALQACAPLPVPTSLPPPAAPPVAKGEAPAIAPPLPIPTRVIQLTGECSQTEADGFREEARVHVTDNEVRSLTWRLWVPKHRGQCSFDLAEFRQTRSVPHIELKALDGSACTLMVWQDPRRVTLAHARCEKRCTPGIYEQAWPVMFDPASGRCARLR
jgi:hypothetical protein